MGRDGLSERESPPSIRSPRRCRRACNHQPRRPPPHRARAPSFASRSAATSADHCTGGVSLPATSSSAERRSKKEPSASHNKARLWRIALYFCHCISRMTDPMWRILLSFPLRCSKIPSRSSCSRWKKNGGRECRDLDGAMQMNFICITGCFWYISYL